MSGGGIKIPNPHLSADSEDVLYHFGFATSTYDFPKVFGDVKFVLCGGTMSRMFKLANFLEDEFGEILNFQKGESSKNYSLSDRFCIYKVGPILCVSHGIGTPSLSVVLTETLKLLFYAKCSHVTFIRIGTSGGIGVEPGTVVISNGSVNGLLEPYHTQLILGSVKKRPAKMDQNLAKELYCLKENFSFPVVTGLTMCCDDFYEAQGRLDGAICEYSETEKLAFLEKAKSVGVVNIEMESTCFASFCYATNIRGAIICSTLVNRLCADQLSAPKSLIKVWEARPMEVVSLYIKNCLNNHLKIVS